ncbi:MAG: bacillithiol biosynthesis cysteine-adding enzyme BshC [Candidatus Heimdallarchaeota archaeon]
MDNEIELELLQLEIMYPNEMLLDYLRKKNPMYDYFGSSTDKLHPIKYPGDRGILKEILVKYNKSIGAPNEVMANLDQVENKNTQFVITGQQPGFLTGPLYTIYKTLSAINYAERYSTKDMKLIPLFWNASEDHDVEEVNNIWILNKENDIEPVKVEDETMYGKSLESIDIDRNKFDDLINCMEDTFPKTDFSDIVFNEIIRGELDKSKKWGEYVSRLSTKLMGQWGLVLIEPNVLRPHLKDYFTALATNPVEYNNIFLNNTNKLTEMGYKPKMHKKENIVGLFYIDKNNYRNTISVNVNNEYEIMNNDSMSKEEIINEIDAHPERFSTNAIFRPIAQDLIFPTYIFVGGPSEIGYHIQIRDLYKKFNLVQPNLFFRMGATIIERHINKIIDKYDFDITDLRDVNRLTNTMAASENKEFLNNYFNQISTTLDSLNKDLGEINKELGSRSEYKKKSIMKELEGIEKMFTRYTKENNSVMQNQLFKARSYLFPSDKPQERVFNIFQYLNKYSPKLLSCIKNLSSTSEPGNHVVLKCWMF